MWPMLLDYTKDESKRILRRLELEAYASIISVFRAQGDLSKDKKKILQDLQQTLSISTERHRAEVRRAINDEKLATIADNIAGTMSTAEWMIEGRRLVPLMPRLVPQTAFTATANQAASAMMEKNASLPPPSQTANKDGPTAAIPKQSRASSPTSNVVVLPSGTSIHIKGMLNQDDDDDLSMPSRRASHRSLSTDSQNAASVSTQTPRITYTTASSTLPGSSPVKITISKSPQGRPISVQSSSQPPKVILVTSAGPSSGTTVIQRSMSVPVVRTPPTTLTTYAGTGPPRTSVLIPGGPSSSGPQVVSAYSGVATSTSNSNVVSTAITMPTSMMSSSPAMFSPSVQIGLGKVRPRIVPRQRYPAVIPTQKPGVVIPMGPQLSSPTAQSVSTGIQASQSQHSLGGIQVTPGQHGTGGIQVKTLSKPTIQIKQEGGMKIITQGGSSKILPKPSQISGSSAGNSSGTPVVMVNTGQSSSGSSSAVTMLPRSISTYTAHSGGKVLNITTPGGRVIATTTKATNVVTVNPKTLHLTAVKSGSGSTTVSKPNVIVVQKTQHARFQSPIGQGGTNIRTISTSSLPGAIDKHVVVSTIQELMGLVHKDSQGRHVLTSSSPTVTSTSTGRGGERRVIITTSGGSGEPKQPVSIIRRGRADSEGKSSSILAELISQAGIVPSDAAVETTAQGTDPYDFDTTDSLPQTLSTASLTMQSATPFRHIQQQQQQHQQQQQQQQQQQSHLARLPLQRRLPQQQDLVESGTDEETPGYSVQTEERRSSQDSESGSEQVFTLEQAMSLLNKDYVDLTEQETAQATSATVAAAATVLPPPILVSSTSTSVPSIPPVTQLHGQPKVSILSTSKAFSISTSTNRETAVSSVPPAEVSLSAVVVSPEEGLKEGQLDTQTGLFYQVRADGNYTTATTTTASSITTTMSSSTATTTTTTTTFQPVRTVQHTVVSIAQPSAQLSSIHQQQHLTSFASTLLPSLSPSSSAAAAATVVMAPPVPPSSSSSSLTQPPLDLLSSSLAEAEINLDPFQDEDEEDDYGDDDIDEEEEEEVQEALAENEVMEGEGQVNPTVSVLGQTAGGESGLGSRPGMAEVLREETAKDGTRILTVSNPASSQQESTVTSHGSLLVSLPSQLTRPSSHPSSLSSASSSPSSSFVSVQETVVLGVPGRPSSVKSMSIGSTTSAATSALNPAPATHSLKSSPQPSVLPIAVSVEQSPSVITFKLDELTSQRVSLEDEQLQLQDTDPEASNTSHTSGTAVETSSDHAGPMSESTGSIHHEDFGSSQGSDPDSHSDGLTSSDPSGLLRSSKRKRKHPSGLDEPSQAAPGSWVKAAASLLMKVARFKGSPRDRNEIPAAEWFTFPVDPQDAPDYYTVISTPMDFSTMRKKLETGQYSNFEEFQADMEQIRTNCYLYNSEGTKVRRDCDEVMAFYRAELAKLQDKQLNKAFMQSTSSPLKRPRVDERGQPKP